VGKGLNRRSFVRGATGAVGMGAVGVLSSKLRYATAKESGSNASQQLHAEIDVKVVDVGDAKHSGRPERWKIVCPDVEAGSNSNVKWKAEDNVAEIQVVSFKGRSPFKHSGKELQVLQPGVPGTTGDGTPTSPLEATTAGNTDGTYSYSIVVKATGDPADATGPSGAVRTKDPDLDII